MSKVQRTSIEWCDYSANPIKFDIPTPTTPETGLTKRINLCVPISAGCKNCYASAITKRFHRLSYNKQAIDSATCVIDEPCLEHMLNFKPRGPFKNGSERPKVFVGDMTDIFGEWVTFGQLDQLFAVFALRPDVDWLLLTKRPERMAEYLITNFRCGGSLLDNLYCWASEMANWVCDKGYRDAEEQPDDANELSTDHVYDELLLRARDGFLENVHLGTSIEDQPTADERIPYLLKCPASVRFLSYEPALGAVELTYSPGMIGSDKLSGPLMPAALVVGREPGIDWVICGGESGPGARPMHPDWVRSIRGQCNMARVPFFFKQWGEYLPSDMVDDVTRDKMHARYRCGALSCSPELIHYFRPNGELVPAGDGCTEQGYITMYRVGKKKAGRLLDGVEHNAMPELPGAVLL